MPKIFVSSLSNLEWVSRTARVRVDIVNVPGDASDYDDIVACRDCGVTLADEFRGLNQKIRRLACVLGQPLFVRAVEDPGDGVARDAALVVRIRDFVVGAGLINLRFERADL